MTCRATELCVYVCADTEKVQQETQILQEDERLRGYLLGFLPTSRCTEVGAGL